MNKRDREAVKRSRGVSRALRDAVVDASDEEFRQSLEEAGEDLGELAERGRGAVAGALRAFAAAGAECRNEAEAAILELHRGLSILIQMLRRCDQLSEEELAERADVTAEEIRRIEFDPTFTPKPRTIYQLEQYFRLPARTLVRLSGASSTCSEELRDEAVRFAAQSTGMGKLSREEKKLLNAFVRYLAEGGK